MTVADLSCMDGANMAAIALQMKLTALEAEQRIFGLEHQLRAALNRPTIVQRSTALITGILVDPFAGEQSIGPLGGGTFVTDFNNTGVNANIDSTAQTLIGLLGEGLYEIGISCNLIPSGATTDNSYRLVRIAIGRQDPTVLDGQTIVQESSMTEWEANVAIGVDVSVVDTFFLHATDQIKFLVQHSNAGSSLNASIGTLIYLSKLSSDDAVVVT